MKDYKKLIWTAFAFLVFLIPLIQITYANATTLNGKEKTLQFLSDVIVLDLQKYNVTLRTYIVSYPAEYDGAPKEEVRYILETNGGYLDATCWFLKGTFSDCLLSWREGGPIYAQSQPANQVDFVKDVLQKYQAYIGSNRHQLLIDMLNSINKVENTVVVTGNYKLAVSVNGRNTGFVWWYNIGGAETIALNIKLQNGAIRSIGDATGLFTVSSEEAKVSREQAIEIALDRARDFNWTLSDGTSVKADSIPSELAVAQLFLTASLPRDPFTYYPFWRVDLWLGKTYPGGVNHIAVGIWADTGEISYIQALGGGGGPAPENPDSSSTVPSTNVPSQPYTPIPDSTSPPGSTSTPDTASPPTQQSPDTETPADTTSPTDNSAPSTSGFPTALVVAAATIGVIATTATALLVKKKRT